MQGVAVRVRNGEDVHHYAYECHTPERLAEIVEGTVRAMPEGWTLESVEVA